MRHALRYVLFTCLIGSFVLAGVLAAAATPSSRTAAASADLAGEWHLDEVDGADVVTTPDSSGNGLNGTVNGVELTDGRWGKGLLFSAQSEMRVAAPGSVLEPAAVTLLAWVKAAQSPGQYRYLAAEGAHGCAASSYALYTGASGGLVFYVDGGGAFWPSPDAGEGIWDGNWHAVAGTFDGKTVRLFVDGTEVGSGTPAATAIDYAGADQSKDFTLGDYPAHAACQTIGLSGRMDEVRVYSRALTTDEIHLLQTSNGDTPPELPPPPPAKRTTSTSVSCSPATVTTGGATRCTATVADTAAGAPSTPTGSVKFGSNAQGTFAPEAACPLSRIDSSSAGCSVQYTPTRSALAAGTHRIDAAYGGDGAHTVSAGAATVAVKAPPNAPRNTALPQIRQEYSCAAGVGRCRAIPYQYTCDPGTWVDNDPGAPFAFEWQQLYNKKAGKGIVAEWRREGTGQSFYARERLGAIDFPTGLFRCAVTATGPGGSTVAYSPSTKLSVGPTLPPGIRPASPADIVVTGIEVTQAVQESHCGGCLGTLPSRNQSNPTRSPGVVTYPTEAQGGVPMAAGKFTVARVYAHVTSGTLTGATAQLEVLDSNGNRISTLSPDSGPKQLTTSSCAGVCVNAPERANPGSSFNFLVPWQETYHRFLGFRATVSPPSGPGARGQCSGCRGNVFTLRSVPFLPTATVPIHPIPLVVGSSGRCGTVFALGCTRKPVEQVFADTETLLPEQFQLFPYRPILDATGLNACQAAAAVSQRGSDDNLGPGDYGVGVFARGEGSLANGCTLGGYTLFNNGAASAVQDDRPVTSVTHEIGHGLGLAHADTGSKCGQYPVPGSSPPAQAYGCPGPHPDGTADCGGNSGGQQGETWDPDNEGRLQSIGLDRRAWDIYRTGSLPGTFVEGFDHAGNPTAAAKGGARYYDFMSYCPSGGVIESLDWISQRNWDYLIHYHAPDNRLPAAVEHTSAVQGTPVRVIAIVDPSGRASIFNVAPGQKTIGGPTSGSPYRIELRNSAGRVIESAVPTTTHAHIDGVSGRIFVLLETTLPFAPASEAVTVSIAGQVVARRARSAHAPKGSFVSPRPGSKVGHGSTTLVRWTASDPDGDPLTATVDYSPDGGRHWQVVADRLRGRSASVPSRFISASRNGRLRVRISDGFDVTTVTSGKLLAQGAPPVVRIVGGPRRGHVRSTTSLLLQGSAFDDADRPLTGGRLRWFAGKRLIGLGERITVTGLAAGRTTIRLVATDSHGRSSQAVLPLHVDASLARYVVFDAPLLVSIRARSLRMRIAASAPATFTIAGKHFAVARTPRAITVRFKPGKSILRLPCSLRSAGGVVRGTYVVLRGR